MISIALLTACSLFTQSGATVQGHGVVTLAGRVVSIQYPSAVVRQIPEEVKSWDGFGGVSGVSVDWRTPFSEASIWKPLADRLIDLTSVKEQRTLRAKVVLLTHADYLDSIGSLKGQSRSRLTDPQVDAVLRALARVPGLVRAETNGALNAQFDLTIDAEPVLFDSSAPSADWLGGYLAPRFNRGRFDADDKEFRGPYDAVILLHPGYEKDLKVVDVQGQGVASASVYNDWSGVGEANGLESTMSKAMAACALHKYRNWGIYVPARGGGQGVVSPTLLGLFEGIEWNLLLGSQDPNIADLKKLYELAAKDDAAEIWNEGAIDRASPLSANISLTVVDDSQRGKVLRYAETASARRGGFALPYRDIDSGKSSRLSFYVKSDSADPIELRYGDGASMAPFANSVAIPVPNDKAWHQVVVDLKGSQKIQELFIGPAADSQRFERRDVGEVVYYFDDFQLSAEGQPTSTERTATAEWQRAAGARSMSVSELAKDVSDTVRLNGLIGRTEFAAGDEAALSEMAKIPNARIAVLAVRGLAKLGTPTAKAEVLRLATSSPFEPVKQAAVIELGGIGDPKTAGPISRLFASRYWQTRMAGAKALTMIPGDEPAVISMTFLQETDPVIRWTVTEGANIQNAVVQKRLLWSAVNDPSDSVRAASDWKLIQSGRPKDVAEGYKGVRDDSLGVRMELLNRMIQSPAAAHRGALRVAVTDASPAIRAKALEAFAKMPGEVQVDEIANVMEDKFPIVQLALLDLAKAKNMSLPANAINSLRSSFDPRVVQRIQEPGR